MSQNEDALAALVLAQQRALETANTRLVEASDKLSALERTYKSLVSAMPDHGDTPFQCDQCELWVDPDDIIWTNGSQTDQLCTTCVKRMQK